MAHFDLSNYETVASRITRFWEENPDGRIHTRLLNYSDNGKQNQFVVLAEVYVNKADESPVATGLAEEHFMDRGPNETSPLENAETSAIGRALVNWRYSSTADKRPSREEMEVVSHGGGFANEPSTSVPGVPERITKAVAGDKFDAKQDERWIWIRRAANEMPESHRSYKFVTDVYAKGEKWTLTEKQVAGVYKAACDFLGQPTAANLADLSIAFPGAKVEDPTDASTFEPF